MKIVSETILVKPLHILSMSKCGHVIVF